MEHAYPVRLERYALRDDSGGTGAKIGGTGVIRDYRAMADGMRVSVSAERQHVPAPGMEGGGAGAVGEFILNPGLANETRLGAAMADVDLPRGSVISIRTPGGGGYGKPVT